MAKGKKKGGILDFVENYTGDKVIWMVVLLLMMFSILSVFSSTSLLAQQKHESRISIVKVQCLVVLAGLAIITFCCWIKNIKVFETISKYGFAFSLILLLWIVFKIKTPIIRAADINGAWRVIKVFGFQIHVYEVVKVAMIMYLAWAVNALKEDSFTLLPKLAGLFKHPERLNTTTAKKVFYIYIPILITTGLILVGGTSSALFIGMMMILTIFIGGVNLKEVFFLGLAAVAYVGIVIGLYDLTKNNEKPIVLSERITTARSRMDTDMDQLMQQMLDNPRNSKEFQDAADALKQPVSALIAIKEGGVLGKGPGRSTQRYIVPVLFGDYMFSFFVEEYGLWGALLLIILYASLLSRGALLAKNCDNYFAKVVLAGLVLLISCQAFMHMAINVHLAPQTGQTLPLISHGTSSFLAFSFAFGIILSISRMIHTKVQKTIDKAEPIVAPHDEIRDSISQTEEEI